MNITETIKESKKEWEEMTNNEICTILYVTQNTYDGNYKCVQYNGGKGERPILRDVYNGCRKYLTNEDFKFKDGKLYKRKGIVIYERNEDGTYMRTQNYGRN